MGHYRREPVNLFLAIIYHGMPGHICRVWQSTYVTLFSALDYGRFWGGVAGLVLGGVIGRRRKYWSYHSHSES